jgi:hypothetical protein
VAVGKTDLLANFEKPQSLKALVLGDDLETIISGFKDGWITKERMKLFGCLFPVSSGPGYRAGALGRVSGGSCMHRGSIVQVGGTNEVGDALKKGVCIFDMIFSTV